MQFESGPQVGVCQYDKPPFPRWKQRLKAAAVRAPFLIETLPRTEIVKIGTERVEAQAVTGLLGAMATLQVAALQAGYRYGMPSMIASVLAGWRRLRGETLPLAGADRILGHADALIVATGDIRSLGARFA